MGRHLPSARLTHPVTRLGRGRRPAPPARHSPRGTPQSGPAGPLEGGHTGPSPVARARPGSKYRLITNRHGTPLAASLTGGTRHDVTQLMHLLGVIPHIHGLVDRPRHRSRRLFADRAYIYDKYRRLLRARGIAPKITSKGTVPGFGLGKTRWFVKRALPGVTSSHASGSAMRYGPTSTSD
ncbi:transposase [Streptomyces sp. SID2131]|nr:transposase [Streptomyces sp. SID2131]